MPRYLTLLLMTVTLSAQQVPIGRDDIVVCVGGSNTDGNTWPQIVMQALGERSPVLVCAGIGGDTVAATLERFDRDVASFSPSLVVVSAAGINDAKGGVAVDDYGRQLRQVIARIRGIGARAVVMTPCIVVPLPTHSPEEVAKRKAMCERLDQYAKVVPAIARDLDVPLADVHSLLTGALTRGEPIMADDGIHSTYLGQSYIARALLDALGMRDAALPTTFTPRPYPGLVTEWEVEDPSGAWVPYRLPEPAPQPAVGAEEWKEQMRRNGFAMRLAERFGKAKLRLRATISDADGGRRWINLGGGVKSLAVDGVAVPVPTDWRGYHAGYARLPVEFTRGNHRIEIAIDGMFTLLITRDRVWEGALR